MAKTYNDSDLLKMLWEMVRGTSQKQVADQLGLSRAMLNDVLHGRRYMTERLAEAMGFKREVIYRRAA